MQGERFDIAKLMRLKEEFAEYPTAKYRQARGVLEGDANNLPALFFGREFSPPEEYEGNARRLLRTANRHPVSLSEVKDLLDSSKAFKAELLLTLNEQDTACDSKEGWDFLAREAAKTEHARNPGVASMRECLEFMLFVDCDLRQMSESLRDKAVDLEVA